MIPRDFLKICKTKGKEKIEPLNTATGEVFKDSGGVSKLLNRCFLINFGQENLKLHSQIRFRYKEAMLIMKQYLGA